MPDQYEVNQAAPLSTDERRTLRELIDRELVGVMNHVQRGWLESARWKLADSQDPQEREQ